ncbi:MAG: hypothetical protein IT168_31085 [Bryobacterales bacterium]|nr:hypothetical protein [Bryobacterales bacterium]
MAKRPSLIEVSCPCCEATLRIDPETGAVITSKAKEKPAPIEDLNLAVSKLKEEAAKRDERFQKSMQDEKNRAQILSKKFDELFKQAKSDPDVKPPHKDIDWD